jgi:hypothetical protein
VEVVVAIFVLMLVLLPTMSLVGITVKESALAREKVTATEMAETGLEQLAQEPLWYLEQYINATDMPDLAHEQVNGIWYTVTSYISWLAAGASPDLCTSGSAQVISATATATWGKGQELAESTVIAPPQGEAVFYLGVGLTAGQNPKPTQLTADERDPEGDLVATDISVPAGATLTIGADTADSQPVTVSADDNGTDIVSVNAFTPLYAFPVGTPVALPGEGFLAVQVNKASGGGPPGNVNDVAVTITPNPPLIGGAETYTPDNEGCVYQQELPGSYSIGFSTDAGVPQPFMNGNLALTEAVTAQVLAYSTTRPTLGDFDQSALVTFAPAGAVPVASGTPVNVASGSIGAGSATVISSAQAMAGTTTADVYPSASTYTAWYGDDCVNEEPPSLATTQFTAPEDGTAYVTVGGLTPLSLTAEAATIPVDGASVAVTGANCAANSTLTLPNTSGPTASTQAAIPSGAQRQDTANITNNSATVADLSIATTDNGKTVSGANIPANAYVYNAQAGASFKLSASPVSFQALTATASTIGETITLVGSNYSLVVTKGANQTTWPIVANPNGVYFCTPSCAPAGAEYETGTATTVGVPLP